MRLKIIQLVANQLEGVSMDNKIKMLHFLKSDKTRNFQLEHILALLLDNSVSFIEVRRFLLHKYPASEIEWTAVEDRELLSLSIQAESYIKLNLQEWKQEYQRYLSEKDELRQRRQRVSAVLSINSSLNNVEMREVLKNVMEERRSLAKLHKNSQKIAEIEAQNRQISHLLEILENQLQYEGKNEPVWHQSDEQMGIRVKQIAKKFDVKLQNQKNVQEEVYRQMVQRALEEYSRKLLVMKKRLYQIFLYYCRQNNLSHLTFEDYSKGMKQIDLRLFLKYFKDYKFAEFNKYRFRLNAATLMFRAQASNGLSLHFQQFWNIHKQFFQMRDLNVVQLDIASAAQPKLEQLKQSIETEIHKFQEFSEIVNEAITIQILQFANLANPLSQLKPSSIIKKSYSSVILRKKALKDDYSHNGSKKAAKVGSSVSSIYYQKSALSSNGLYLSIKRPNLIQQSRKLVVNDQESNLINSKIKRADSLWSQNSELKRSKIGVSLPKILKLSNDEISSQGIYQSLKHFANFDYVAQQKKLKDLIGVSKGEDMKYLQVLLQKQTQEREQRKREKSEQREERRKQQIELVAKKQQHHCKRYHPQEVQPYMRF